MTDISLYTLLCCFFIYSFLGWCAEVSFMALYTGEFVNRGFLNGPVCPIYGISVLLVVLLLTPVYGSLLLLFICSTVLCTLLEYITGCVLERVFHNKWWDYSEYPFNLNGYVCLKFSVMWGLACTFVIRLVHPLVLGAISAVPVLAGRILLILFSAVFIADIIVTVAFVLKLNTRLKQLDEISRNIRKTSDFLGENISGEVLELKDRYDKLNIEEKVMHSRLLRAFPNMKSHRYSEILEELKSRLHLSK